MAFIPQRPAEHPEVGEPVVAWPDRGDGSLVLPRRTRNDLCPEAPTGQRPSAPMAQASASPSPARERTIFSNSGPSRGPSGGVWGLRRGSYRSTLDRNGPPRP